MLTDPLLHTAMDSVLDGMITIDEKGTVQCFNPAAERIFGYTATHVLGQNVRLLMPEPRGAIHTSDPAIILIPSAAVVRLALENVESTVRSSGGRAY